MLSKGAFNALLKTIEEPPEHVMFILATTETHKVPATILSRCQRFEFRRIEVKDSAERIISVAKNENFTITKDAAELISRISDGGMRDALSLLDTCASVTKEITDKTVRECAGIAGKDSLFAISRAIKNKDAAAALREIDEFHKASGEMGRLIEELILHFRNLMLIKNAPGETDLLTALPSEIPQYKAECKHFGTGEILRYMEVLGETAEKMARGSSKKTQAEIALVRLCTGAGNANAGGEEVEPAENRGDAGTPQSLCKSPPGLSEQFAPPNEQFAPPNEQFAPPSEQFAPPSEQFAPPSEQFAPPSEQFAPPNEQFAPPTEQFAPPSEQFAPPSEQFAPPSEQFAPPTEQFAPPNEQFAPPSEQFAPPSEQSTISSINWEPILKAIPTMLAGVLGGYLKRHSPVLRQNTLYLPETAVINGILKNKSNLAEITLC
jgi:DNA polymerase-3 subunit gamma/tau